MMMKCIGVVLYVQVQYLFRVFCRLRPGISILALHGKQQQMKRVEVYNDFVRKTSAVLFATDIAARGLGNGNLFCGKMHILALNNLKTSAVNLILYLSTNLSICL